MIGLIGAMRIEVEALQQEMIQKKQEVISGMTFVSGFLYGKEVVVAESGVGKVFSALCAQTMILHYHVTQIINTGVGGTLTDRLSIGQIAIANEVVQHDMDTSPLGDPVGLLSG
ncbi:MAG: 5'-methylthioadenosine/S-adenosylhomocysteine nucleosidase, partial [Ruminococcaceae bacterium]|nr:5'-methylthioadenosine/S-adenosylhomocysteine nucleosidase [Oscillospiraceae bacterium]